MIRVNLAQAHRARNRLIEDSWTSYDSVDRISDMESAGLNLSAQDIIFLATIAGLFSGFIGAAVFHSFVYLCTK